jgi:murein DD-endopeptidase MepM/ murein hydrolase activator NlpD
VESGFISRGFGEQPHPILKRVKTNNKGVYIQTKENEQIRAVFDGVVTRVIEVPGMNYAALVRHGEYMTVYANLRAVDVKPGQQINIKDPIGTVFTDAEGISEIYFQVWKNNDILNPQSWLSRK